MKHALSAVACAAMACLLVQPAAAWFRGGGSYSGGHWGAAAGGGHWAAGGFGHYGSGTYGTTSGGTHYATTSRGGSAEAGQRKLVGHQRQRPLEFRELWHDGLWHPLRDWLVWRSGGNQ
jgi:hypothetical protein